MTIPALSTSDKSFICSYNIGVNIDFRLALGVMNEITTYTTEYIEGRCWIPVFAPTETNDHSNFWDEPEKDVVYIKVGCRISSDGYIHTWLMDTQSISELVLWNNHYNTSNQPKDDTTTLHWTIEKLYRQVIGNTTEFIAANIKFQKYFGGTYLQLFGNHIARGSITYSTSGIISSGATWYPTNTSVVDTDRLYVVGNLAAGTSWAPSYSYSKFDKVDATVPNGYVYEANNSGTSGASEPTWNTIIGSTTSDGSITWRCTSVPWKGRYVIFDTDANGYGNISDAPDTPPVGMSSDATEPIFWITTDWLNSSVSVSSHCQPASCGYVFHARCNGGLQNFIGVQSGRSYPFNDSAGPGCYPALFPYYPEDSGNAIPGQTGFTIDECTNTAYIWVPSYCSGASGDSQSECEGNGGTWIPGHYECDPSFTYDSSVNYQYKYYTQVYPDWINYTTGEVKFSTPSGANHITCLARYADTHTIDTFSEDDGDLNELKSHKFTSTQGGCGRIVCKNVPHMCIGLISTAIETISYSDWKISWGANNYFNSWTTPDGLGARSPGSTQILLTRPLTHHDGFYTGATDIEGGFIYEPATSDAFLSRTISNETKIHIPLSHNTGFSWLYESTLSNGFLSRSIDVEAKLHTPISFNTGFDWMYESITSAGFLSRTIDNEIKIETPLSFNTGFSWLYKLEEPWVSKHRFLKIGGNDADDGLTFATAWEHWSHAMATIAEDGRLYAADGTYSESVEMSPQKAFELFLIDATGEDAPAEVIITPA